MSKTIVLSALQTDGTDPGFNLTAPGIGTPAVVEGQGRHAFGTVSRAGSHVLYLHAERIPEYDGAGISGASLQVSMPAAGYVTFWSAAAFTPQQGSWQAVAGAQNGAGQTQQDPQPGDWRQFYLPLPVGQCSIGWQFFTTGDDASARAMWVSRIEVYAGTDKPDGIGPYFSGSLQDPNTVKVEVLGFDDASTADGVTLTGAVTIEPKGAHPPPGDADGRAGAYVAHFTGEGRIDWALTATADPRSYVGYTAAVRPGGGDFIEYRGEDDWNYPNADGTWQDIEESFDPGTYAVSWRNPAGTEAWLTRVLLFYPGPDSTMDVSPAAVTEGPDDGTGGGGGGTGPTPSGYGASDLVRHKGGLYLARVPNPQTEPGPGDSADWYEMVPQPAAAVASPFDIAVRAKPDGASPFAPGQRGLWVVLSDDETTTIDLRYENGM